LTFFIDVCDVSVVTFEYVSFGAAVVIDVVVCLGFWVLDSDCGSWLDVELDDHGGSVNILFSGFHSLICLLGIFPMGNLSDVGSWDLGCFGVVERGDSGELCIAFSLLAIFTGDQYTSCVVIISFVVFACPDDMESSIAMGGDVA
jgi:hypothetical protein